jgi:signal transduction histidine kinase
MTSWPGGRLRYILPAAFGSLLLLMLAAGLGALQTLRDLHQREETLRTRVMERGRALSTLCTSLDLYGDHIQRFLINPDSGESPELTRLDGDIESILRSFPPGSAPEERELVGALEKLFDDERGIVRSVTAWSPAQRRRDGPRILIQEVLPRGEQIVSMYDRVSIWNSRQIVESQQQSLARFAELQGDLGRLLMVALGAGTLLSIASAFYILRLEKQGNRQFAEMQRLSASLVDAQEAERRTISRELHDEVGQLLGAALVDLGRLASIAPTGDPALKETISRIRGATEKTVRSVRDMALLLRPSMIDDLGLVAALEWQGRELSRRGDMEVDVEARNVSPELPDEVQTCVYRVVQEALNNAARHAGAGNARVFVEQNASGIDISIHDDGRGFDPQNTRGLGMVGMEERVRRLNGNLRIESQPGKGTTVFAHLPWPPGVST